MGHQLGGNSYILLGKSRSKKPMMITTLSMVYHDHSSVLLLSHVLLLETPWTEACQASLSITNSWSLLKLMSVESVKLSNHLILCYPHLLLPPKFPRIRAFFNESALCIRWPKYWSFSFSTSPSNWIFRTGFY